MNKNNRTLWRIWESHEAHQYVCNDVDPSSDAFVSELRITSSGKDILPDLVAGAERLLTLCCTIAITLEQGAQARRFLEDQHLVFEAALKQFECDSDRDRHLQDALKIVD